MFTRVALPRRGVVNAAVTGFVALALAGCASVIPKSEAPTQQQPEAQGPSAGQLPDKDEDRHRVALLVPMSGENAKVGQALSNAATMALLDTNTANIRITTYDTAAGAANAARKAVADGNRLILGPLLGDDVAAVKGVASPASVPMVSFSNNTAVAGDGVFVMGQIPAQSIERTMRYAIGRGLSRFGAVVPQGEYGKTASDAMLDVARAANGKVLAIETYDRSEASLNAAVRRLVEKGDYDAILIADSARMAVRAAPLIRGADGKVRLLGTELWSMAPQIAQSSDLSGAWFSAISDGRFARFTSSYRSRFGTEPYRVSTLGYDAVLLTIKIARDWKVGDRFPVSQLRDQGGFIGLDGAFRFDDGIVERAFEVREVGSGGVRVVSPAPARFGD